MKVLVVGGMHGNEPLGLEVVKLFQGRPVKNIDVTLANEEAVVRRVRFTGNDLNRSFPGSGKGKSYEERRAAELLELCKGYDVVLDFHNTHCPKNDCGFVGQGAKRQLYDVASWLGLKRVIVADYDCINKYAPNCISVEISLDSPEMDAEKWYRRIKELSACVSVPRAEDVKKYRFVYRMTLEDRDRLELPKKGLRAFRSIDFGLAKAMGVKSPAYPIFIGDGYTPYNYGGLLNNIPDGKE